MTAADPELRALAHRLVAAAAPGEQVEVVVARGTTTTVRAYGGDVESLTVADTAAVGVRVLRDGRAGFASAGTLDGDVADALLGEARDNLTFAAPDPHLRLAEPDDVPPVVHDLWDDRVEATPLDDKVAMAIELERATLAGDPRVHGVRSSTYGDRQSQSVLVSSTGMDVANRSTMASVGVAALASEGDRTQNGAASDAARSPVTLDIARVADEAVERATSLLAATQPESARVSLVLEPRMAASILGIVGGMLSAERLLKGRTPFADRVGDVIADPRVSLVDDPTDPASYGARSWDGEGLTARRNPLITNGVLDGFLHNSHTASQAGTTSTASASRGARSTPGVSWHALALAPGEGTLDDLIEGVSLGVLVQSMTGLHSGVNAISGDFSVGVEGRMIRDGALAEPIREATVASTLPRLLLDVSAIGADLDHRPGAVSCPTVVFDDVSLGGR